MQKVSIANHTPDTELDWVRTRVSERTENNRLLQVLVPRLLADLHQTQYHNIDYWRFPTPLTVRLMRAIKDAVIQLAAKAKFVRSNFPSDIVSTNLMRVLSDIEGLNRFYGQLNDEASRNLLVDLLKFRILGNRYVRLPLNNEQFWKIRDSIDKRFLKQQKTIKAGPWHLNRYVLDEHHGSVELNGHCSTILNTFLLEQYAYRKNDCQIEVKRGDIVIDAGGCWGDTALYFAHKVGAKGEVYSFEFVPDNLTIFEQNIRLNKTLAERIHIVRNPVWNRSDEPLRFRFNGPSTTLELEKTDNGVEMISLSIDDLVKRENLERVDFIKMDIEGAELSALRGAEQTIRAFKPTLAVSVYHKDDDFITISEYLNSLNMGYELFLDHFTIHREETVLFARPHCR